MNDHVKSTGNHVTFRRLIPVFDTLFCIIMKLLSKTWLLSEEDEMLVGDRDSGQDVFVVL